MADTLVMVTRLEDLPESQIPKGLQKVKATGRCDFCQERVLFNTENIKEIRQKGNKPALCCIPCYRDGAHIRGGYRGT